MYLRPELLQSFADLAQNQTAGETFRAPNIATLNDWFNALQQYQAVSAGTDDYYQHAVDLICKPGGLEAGRLYLRSAGEWKLRAATEPLARHLSPAEERLLSEMLHRGETCFHSSLLNPEQLKQGTAAILAPLFNRGGKIIGAMWGERRIEADNQRRGIRELEARWLQLLSETLTSGLIRLEEEQRHAQTRLLLDQAFPAKVSERLLTDPTLLDGRERNVTILFADLQQSTSLFEQLKPAFAYALLGEVMEELTEVAQAHSGVLIDYYGDGLAVMWNAPADQPGHPLLACRAAVDMQNVLGEIDRRWKKSLVKPLQLGIGIHTGKAFVGNSGSHLRIKYGPRGPAVVLASRLESATRPMQASILLSEDTARELPADVVTRRLCRARFPQLQEPIQVHELCALQSGQLSTPEQQFIRDYESVVDLYEDQQIGEACYRLVELEQDPLSQRYPVQFLSNYLSALNDTDKQRRQNDKRRDQLTDPAILLDLK